MQGDENTEWIIGYSTILGKRENSCGLDREDGMDYFKDRIKRKDQTSDRRKRGGVSFKIYYNMDIREIEGDEKREEIDEKEMRR